MAGGINSIVDGGAAAGGKTVGAGLIMWTAYRLFVFGCNFLAGRHDARQKRLDELDLRLATSLGKRLTHLEKAEESNQRRIRVLEGWLSTMATELRRIDPENSRLKELAEALRHGVPVAPPDHALDELMRHASRAVDGDDGA